MSTPTRRASTTAAPRGWRRTAACQGIDLDTVFSDRPRDQEQVQGVCRGCPVRSVCLSTTIATESADYMVWGVSGGLTHWQRRALRVEALLGNQPNLEQARQLASPVFAEFMAVWRDWPADRVAAELRKLDVLASAVTVRVALWWTGGKGSVLPPTAEDDRRSPWVQVRDECRTLVAGLREIGVGNQDAAAYLGVSRDALERAVKSWRGQAAREAAAA